MLGVDASRTSYGQGQGQGQSSDIRNGQQLGNTNPNINHIIYQPNNSPSIVIGLDQNDGSKGKKNDISSATSFTPNNSLNAPTTGANQGMGLGGLGGMINNKSSVLNMALPSLVAGGVSYLVAYSMNLPQRDSVILGALVGGSSIPGEYIAGMVAPNNEIVSVLASTGIGAVGTILMGTPMDFGIIMAVTGGISSSATKYMISKAFNPNPAG